MLEIGKANEVKFKVGVNGTQAPPTVRLVIGVNEHELGFKAEKLLGGADDEWFSEVTIPEDMSAGEYDFRVEVIVNNRLFTPIKRKVAIGTSDPIFVAVSEMQEPHPTQKPKQTETWEGEGGALPAAPEKPQPLPSKPLDPLKPTPPKAVKTIASRPTAPIKGLMREAASQDGTVAHRPAKKPAVVMEAPIKNTPSRVYKPTPAKPKSEPVKITMADIAAESAKRFDDVLKESASYRDPVAPVKTIPIKHQTPTTLTKGDIVYE